MNRFLLGVLPAALIAVVLLGTGCPPEHPPAQPPPKPEPAVTPAAPVAPDVEVTMPTPGGNLVEAEKRFAAGQKLMDKHKWDEAIKEFSAALREYESYPAAYGARGLAYANLIPSDGESAAEKAKADYDKALELDPKLVSAYVDRGYIYMDYSHRAFGKEAEEKKWTDSALADFNQATQLDPKYASAYHGRGDWYYHQQQYEKALEQLNQAIKLDPKDPYAYASRANAYGALGEQAKADADLKKAESLGMEYD